VAQAQSEEHDLVSRFQDYIYWLLQQHEVARFIYMVVIVGTGFYLIQLLMDRDFSYGMSLGIIFAWFVLIIVLEPPKRGKIKDEAFDLQLLDQMVE
jgi:hypothetical protein